MSTLEIVHYPTPVLKQRAEIVANVNGRVVELVESMFPVMYEARGIGLAAPQVGHSDRIFVLDLQREESQPVVCINPEIRERNGIIVAEEGCLSLPNVYAEVERAKELLLGYIDIEGEERTLEADELLSRAIQHELDHLNGILLFERLTKDQRKQIAEQLQDLREGRIPELLERE